MDELKSSVPVKQEINVFSLIFIEKQSYIETSKGWKLVSEVLDCENFNDEYFD